MIRMSGGLYREVIALETVIEWYQVWNTDKQTTNAVNCLEKM